jgi:MFS family permease
MRQPGSRTALLTLTAINLLNFADRYVPSAVKSLIQDDLHLSDFQTSLPSTGMVIVYTIFAIIFGMISDKQYFDRRIILCGAIICWSLATSLAGLATNLTQLVMVRSLVGVASSRLRCCINALNCCAHYLCLRGWVYVFYVGHMDKIMKPFSMLQS